MPVRRSHGENNFEIYLRVQIKGSLFSISNNGILSHKRVIFKKCNCFMRLIFQYNHNDYSYLIHTPPSGHSRVFRKICSYWECAKHLCYRIPRLIKKQGVNVKRSYDSAIIFLDIELNVYIK